MGRQSEMLRITVGASLSRHNSPQDRIDDELWEECQREIREAVDALVDDYSRRGLGVCVC
jgi:hypothetical protein